MSAALAMLLFASGLPARASGAIEIGQASPADPLDSGSVGNLVQGATAAASPSYAIPSSGVITSWAHRGDSVGPGSGRLQVWRFAGGASYTLVGRSALQAFTAAVKTVFLTQIPVIAGDRLGLRVAETTTGAFGAGVSGDTVGGEATAVDPAPGETRSLATPVGSALLNVEATLEPDADGDGFGDETQDQCPGQAGPSGGCPPAAPPPAQPASAAPPASTAAPTGQRAAALKKCAKIRDKQRKRKCKKRAGRLPV